MKKGQSSYDSNKLSKLMITDLDSNRDIADQYLNSDPLLPEFIRKSETNNMEYCQQSGNNPKSFQKEPSTKYFA